MIATAGPAVGFDAANCTHNPCLPPRPRQSRAPATSGSGWVYWCSYLHTVCSSQCPCVHEQPPSNTLLPDNTASQPTLTTAPHSPQTAQHEPLQCTPCPHAPPPPAHRICCPVHEYALVRHNPSAGALSKQTDLRETPGEGGGDQWPGRSNSVSEHKHQVMTTTRRSCDPSVPLQKACDLLPPKGVCICGKLQCSRTSVPGAFAAGIPWPNRAASASM